MSMNSNPLRWSPDVKNVTAVFVLVSTIIGSTWTAASYIGGVIFKISSSQERLIQKIDQLDRAQRDVMIPRISALEGTASAAAVEAATTRTRVDGIKETLGELRSLATQNLAVSNSHTSDIAATKNAVVSKIGPMGH